MSIMPRMNRIFVEALALSAKVGVYHRERNKKQPINVDIEVDVESLEKAFHSELLEDTLNYELIVNAAKKVVAKRHYPLVETLAHEIARGVLKLPRVERVKIRLRKIGCMPEVEAAGVELCVSKYQLDDDSLASMRCSFEDLASQEDIVIIGGGVAGLSAALWCWRLGHPALLIEESNTLGGQLKQVFGQIFDIPAMAPMSGNVLIERFIHQLQGKMRVLNARLDGVDALNDRVRLNIEVDGQVKRLNAKTLLIASGLKRCWLGLANEKEFFGKGILETSSKNTEQYRGQRIAVIGGGDGACENALNLAHVGAEVYIIHRRDSLSARNEFKEKIKNTTNIRIYLSEEVTAFEGKDRLEAITLSSGKRIDVDGALIRIGWLPNSDAYPRSWRDDKGYLNCDANLAIDKHIFVGGDLRRPIAPSIALSMGDGATIARSAVAYLEERTRA